MIPPPSRLPEWLANFLSWADELRRMQVWANADTPEDAAKARELGAQGIGLCRTEHMFMQPERLPIVHEMILATTRAQRAKALDRLLPFQRDDFYGILSAMEGLPVTIRLLDPPLHEFLPSLEQLLVETTEIRLTKGVKSPEYLEREALLRRVQQLHEQNPMLGLRVCRLGIVFPEIYEMQVRAIFEAACALKREGVDVRPEVMIPGVGTKEEMQATGGAAKRVADEVLAQHGIALAYHIGTMIELPRACVVADELAGCAEFFSFGTNDLTQTTYGYSRDDAEGSFIPVYLEKKILKDDPFQVLDRRGVGGLMRQAVELARPVRRGNQDRHLRRARRRAEQRGILRPARARLRLVFSLSRPDRPAGGRAVGDRRVALVRRATRFRRKGGARRGSPLRARERGARRVCANRPFR